VSEVVDMALVEVGMAASAEPMTKYGHHAFNKYHLNCCVNLVDLLIPLHLDFSDISSDFSNSDSSNKDSSDWDSSTSDSGNPDPVCMSS
jgi:hypothetical protein